MEIDLLRVNFRYPSNEPQTLPAFGRLLIQLRLLYYLAAIACVRIYIYARVPIYIYTELFCNLLGTWRETFATRRVSVNRGQNASPRG